MFHSICGLCQLDSNNITQAVIPNCLLCISCSVMSDSATPGTAACQAPLSIGFSRQEYWSVAISFSRDLPNPGIETVSLHWQVGSLLLARLGSPISLIMDVKRKMFLLFS